MKIFGISIGHLQTIWFCLLLLSVFFGIVVFIFNIIMLLDCLKRNFDSRTVWAISEIESLRKAGNFIHYKFIEYSKVSTEYDKTIVEIWQDTKSPLFRRVKKKYLNGELRTTEFEIDDGQVSKQWIVHKDGRIIDFDIERFGAVRFDPINYHSTLIQNILESGYENVTVGQYKGQQVYEIDFFKDFVDDGIEVKHILSAETYLPLKIEYEGNMLPDEEYLTMEYIQLNEYQKSKLFDTNRLNN